MKRREFIKTILCLLFAFGIPVALGRGADTVNLEVVHRIKAEAFKNSQVMDHLFYLTDVNGPRLTGSPGLQTAADWAVKRLKEFGAENPHFESWGPFKRGWSFSSFQIQMNKPVYAPLHGAPMAWSRGTEGPVHAGVIAAPFLHEDDPPWELDITTLNERVKEFREHWQGKLHGKIVLLDNLRNFEQAKEAASERLDEKNLGTLSDEPELFPARKPNWVPDRLPRDSKKRREFLHGLPLEIAVDYWDRKEAAFDRINTFLHDEGVAAVLRTDKRGAGNTLFAEGAGMYTTSGESAPPSVKLSPEQYNRLLRLAEKSIPVEIEINLDVSFSDNPPVANVLAEIPGGQKKDEIVMLGGHLDSWHSGTGATDNGAGCAVVMEAFRILRALDLKMDRTIRLALWSGEEQGLYGSRAYIRDHFADPYKMQLKPEHAKLCGYFNLDNGSGKIRGVYLQGNDMMRPIFETWLAPFKDLAATTISIRNTGGTDHLSFDAVGLPGFQFIQDPLDYETRTHHSEMDVYDHAEPGDLMQASAIIASIVYNAATREALLPRKPLPEALPPKQVVADSKRN
ncbi:MAG TPA: M20/M25/M40 family metallo-hydrolase [Candidatus Limnocylindrales bacterium]|nr:M20/M25/M40 family metallo-hydrolase [Candidatus Limnocylindrales bacterium]